jgi:hypothetical protein
MLPRWFKEAQLTILTMGSTVIIAACSGAPYAGEQISLVTGRVTDQTDQEGIEGIDVCLEIPHEGDTVRTCARTASDGSYNIVDDIYLEQLAADRSATLTVTDDDGETNGAYLDEQVGIPPSSLPTEIDVALEPDPN